MGRSTHLAAAASAPLCVRRLHQAIYVHVDFGRLPKQPSHNQRGRRERYQHPQHEQSHLFSPEAGRGGSASCVSK